MNRRIGHSVRIELPYNWSDSEASYLYTTFSARFGYLTSFFHFLLFFPLYTAGMATYIPYEFFPLALIGGFH